MALERERVEKIVLLGVVVVTAAACSWIFYIAPRIKVFSGGGEDIREMKEKYKEAKQTIERADRSEMRLKELHEDLSNFDRDIPPETKDEWILGKVNAVCRELDIKYESLIPQAPVEFKDKTVGKAYIWKRVKLKIKCGYHKLGRFLNRIENSSPFITVSGLSVEKTHEEDRQDVSFLISYVAKKEQS